MQIPVLDKGWVSLYDTYPNRLNSLDWEIVQSARVSFDGELRGYDKDAKLLEYLIRNHHDSPLEMVDVTFNVYAPVVVWWQWVRHRTFSYNFQSGRYTPFEENDVYIPTVWRKQSKDNKQASDGQLRDERADYYSETLENLSRVAYSFYELALQEGVAKEQARLFLPAWCSYYKARVKANLRNWLHFISLRDHDHAQFEIREYAKVIRGILQEQAPLTLEYYDKHRVNKE